MISHFHFHFGVARLYAASLPKRTTTRATLRIPATLFHFPTSDCAIRNDCSNVP